MTTIRENPVDFISIRDLRSRSAAVWEAPTRRQLVVTSTASHSLSGRDVNRTFDSTPGDLRQAEALQPSHPWQAAPGKCGAAYFPSTKVNGEIASAAAGEGASRHQLSSCRGCCRRMASATIPTASLSPASSGVLRRPHMADYREVLIARAVRLHRPMSTRCSHRFGTVYASRRSIADDVAGSRRPAVPRVAVTGAPTTSSRANGRTFRKR